MTNEEFIIWLVGFLALDTTARSFTRKQLVIIKNHLELALAIDKELVPFNQWLFDDLTQSLVKSDLDAQYLEKFYLAVINKLQASARSMKTSINLFG